MTALLAMSAHSSKNVARPARRALAAFDETDFAALQSPSFTFLPTCPLLRSGGGAAVAVSASTDIMSVAREALIAESSKLIARRKRALAKQQSHHPKTTPRQALEERSSKLEQWIEQRSVQFESEKEAWKKRVVKKQEREKESKERAAKQEVEERRLREIAAEEYRHRLKRTHEERKLKRQQDLEIARKMADAEYARKKSISDEKVKQWMERKKVTGAGRGYPRSGESGESRAVKDRVMRARAGGVGIGKNLQVTGNGLS